MTNEEAVAYIQEWLKDEYALNSKDRKVLNMAVKTLEQEPCEDAISREAILLEIDKIKDNYGGLLDVAMFIRGLPSVQPKQKKGHWIVISPTNMYCSECHEMEHLDTSRKFCGYCGVRMEG